MANISNQDIIQSVADAFQFISYYHPADFISAIHEAGADLVGMSALLTTTMREQQSIIDAFVEAGIREKIKVMVGLVIIGKNRVKMWPVIKFLMLKKLCVMVK